MAWFRCLECGEIFKDTEAASRPAGPEDGVRPWDSLVACPVCGSSELDELDKCALCGAPVTSHYTDFCDACMELIDGAFHDAIDAVHAERGGEIGKLTKLMFDRAEETDFYS